MLAISMFTGFSAFAVLCILEFLLAELEQEPPRWLDYIDDYEIGRASCRERV